ncbi:MAG: class I SAM-dependent methyltransferase [Geminicoccales bacterium]
MAGIHEVEERFPDLLYMNLEQAEILDRFLKEHRLTNCLELGFFHGKSSAFFAAILRDMSEGHLTTIDQKHSVDRSPNIHQVLGTLDLTSWVTPIFEPRSFNWRLMRMLEQQPRPVFDFCYIDAAHTWNDTGFGFFLVDKVLKPGGWILFDDLTFDYQRLIEPGKKPPDYLARMTAEERGTQQVLKVWDLLVKDHPGYDEFIQDDRWAFARKKPA